LRCRFSAYLPSLGADLARSVPSPGKDVGDWAESGCGGREPRSMANVARMSKVQAQM
jgi:hypothetical protein